MDIKILFVLWLCVEISTTLLVRDNVVFKKLSDVHTSKSHWKLTLIEDVSVYRTHTVMAMMQVQTLQMSLRNIRVHMSERTIKPWIDELDRIISDYSSLYREVEEVAEMNADFRKLETAPGASRQKRALLPFLGSLAGFLIGTASEQDIEAVNRNIHRLTSNQNQITHVLNESLTLLDVSRKDISENREKINEILESLTGLNKELQAARDEIEAENFKLEQVVRTVIRGLAAYNRVEFNILKIIGHVKTLNLKLNMLAHGRLSPIVISPETLLQILNEIADRLEPPYILPRKPSKHLWHYYKTLRCSSVINEQKLIMIIDIPLVNSNSRLEIFEIFNLHLTGVKGFDKTTAKYRIDSKGLAINYGRTEYMLLSAHDLAVCSNLFHSYCELENVRYMAGVNLHCEIALFNGDKKKISQNCAAQIYPTTLLPKLENLRDGHWAISTAEGFKLPISCDHPSEKTIEINPPVTIFQLNTSCIATSKFFIIPARRTFQSEFHIKHSMYISPIQLNSSIWSPLGKMVGNSSTFKIPETLKPLRTFSMDRLTSELTKVEMERVMTTNSSEWYWYVLGSIMGILVIIIIALLGWYRRRLFKTKSREETKEVVGTSAEPTEERLKESKEKRVLFMKGDEITGSTVLTI